MRESTLCQTLYVRVVSNNFFLYFDFAQITCCDIMLRNSPPFVGQIVIQMVRQEGGRYVKCNTYLLCVVFYQTCLKSKRCLLSTQWHMVVTPRSCNRASALKTELYYFEVVYFIYTHFRQKRVNKTRALRKTFIILAYLKKKRCWCYKLYKSNANV